MHLPHIVHSRALVLSLKEDWFPAGGPPGPGPACGTAAPPGPSVILLEATASVICEGAGVGGCLNDLTGQI